MRKMPVHLPALCRSLWGEQWAGAELRVRTSPFASLLWPLLQLWAVCSCARVHVSVCVHIKILAKVVNSRITKITNETEVSWEFCWNFPKAWQAHCRTGRAELCSLVGGSRFMGSLWDMLWLLMQHEEGTCRAYMWSLCASYNRKKWQF